MKKASSFWLLPLCLALSACQTGGRWSPNVPQETAALWEKRVSITFTNMSLSNAAAILQAQANKGSRTPVRIVAPPVTDIRTTVSWTAIPVEEALKDMGLLTAHRVFYQGNKAAFAMEDSFDDAVVRIQLRGRCVDALTGKGVACVELDRKQNAGMDDRDGRLANTRLTVTPDTEGRFEVQLQVSGYCTRYSIGRSGNTVLWEHYPDDQSLVMRFSSQSYIPQTIEIPIVSSQKVYSVNVTLKQASSDKAPD